MVTSECILRLSKIPNQGLPFLAEVFASDNGKSVYFLALNKHACQKECTHSFVCGFPDGTRVQLDPVHENFPNDYDWSNAVMVIRCEIPEKYWGWVDALQLPRNYLYICTRQKIWKTNHLAILCLWTR